VQPRHTLRWLPSVADDYLLRSALPWLTFDAADFIVRQMPRPAKVFEYGSGGSTLFWRRLHTSCVSIEHDREWFELLSLRFGAGPVIDYRLVPPEVRTAGESQQVHDSANPKLYLSDDADCASFRFEAYARQIDSYPDGHFDVVLIDGRARPSCIMHAAPKVARGGLLVLDDANREYYTSQCGEFLRDFTRHEFAGVRPGREWQGRTDVYVRNAQVSDAKEQT
jgi:hypothetical protein